MEHFVKYMLRLSCAHITKGIELLGVNNMGYFKERRKAKLQSKNKCPDCRGRGFHAFAGSDFFASHPSSCTGCSGSGLFTHWEKNNG